MRALIVMAHGSRNEAANHEVIEMAQQLAQATAPQQVRHAFLDVLPPTLAQTVDEVVGEGATHVDVLPLFLNSGNHVTRDIPQMLKDARRRYPHVTLRLLQHIGADPRFVTLVESIARDPVRCVVAA